MTIQRTACVATWVILIGTVLSQASTRSGTSELDRVEEDFVVAVTKARESFNESLKKAATKVVSSFDTAIKSATGKGDLDLALQLRDRRAKFSAIAAGQSVWQPLVGTYSAKHVDWPSAVDLIMRDDGTFRIPSWPGDHHADGKWSLSDDNGALSVQWNTFPQDSLLPSFWFQNEKFSMTWKSYAVGK